MKPGRMSRMHDFASCAHDRRRKIGRRFSRHGDDRRPSSDGLPSRGIETTGQFARPRELPGLADGTWVRVAGAVIARQRPGTAKGFVFLSLEDETGIANAIITPATLREGSWERSSRSSFLLVEGPLQNQDNVISVKAERVLPISLTRAETASHDFH